MSRKYMLNVLSEVLALILCEDINGAKRTLRREIGKLEEDLLCGEEILKDIFKS